MISTDIVVIGGGCVGLTAALSLAEHYNSVTVIDRAEGYTELQQAESRVSAISVASQRMLTNLCAWQHMEPSRMSPYQHMSVWDKDSFGRIHFDAHDVNEARLGHIIENNNIRNGLIKVAEQTSNLNLYFGEQISAIHNEDDQVLLTLDSGKIVIAKLVVAADGANSWVKKQLNIATTFADYDHHAIVANIQTTVPHGGCARQVFLEQGPLALLPMYGDDQTTCSIVWSTAPEHAESLCELSDDAFSKALTAATDSVLGTCKVTTVRAKFPLTMRYAQQWLSKRVVLIGDAAHTIHPLAGLGMNLGLLDAASLVDSLIMADGNKTDLSNGQQLNKQLRGYERWRKAEAQTLIAAMASLKNLFDGRHPIKKLIRGVGLKLTDSAKPIKLKIIEQAMGLKGQLPKLAQKIDEI